MTAFVLAALVVAFVLTLALGKPAIGWLRRRQLGDQIREVGLEHHQAKRGTPTMGGLLMIGLVLILAIAIAWQSLEGSMVSTAGSVNFESAPRGTIVRVHFQYNPPAGKVGAAVAWLFGEEPNIQVREDLRRFKEVMEGRQ